MGARDLPLTPAEVAAVMELPREVGELAAMVRLDAGKERA